MVQAKLFLVLLVVGSSLGSPHNETSHVSKRSNSDSLYHDSLGSGDGDGYFPEQQNYGSSRYDDARRSGMTGQSQKQSQYVKGNQFSVGAPSIGTLVGGTGNNFVKITGGRYRIISGNFTVLPSKVFQRYVVQPVQVSSITDLSTVVRTITTQKLNIVNPLVKVMQIGNYAPSGDPISMSCPVVMTENMIPWAPGVMRLDFKMTLHVPLRIPLPPPMIEAPVMPPPQLDSQVVAGQALQDTVVIILQMAATFRRNIVTVMGFVLNNPELHLSQELYMALSQIYNAARLRLIRVADILYVLQTISTQEPQQQCITILKEILSVSPPHVHSSIQLWLHALQHQKIKVNHVFRPNKGPLVIDFLAGIDFAYLNLLIQPIKFPSSVGAHVSQDVMLTMGKMFATICAALVDGSIRPTQSLLAVFLLHIQPNMHAPEVEENLLFLADVLFKEKKELQFVLTQVEKEAMKNPYDMLQSVLTKLIQVKEIDPMVRETIQICLNYLQKTTHVIIDHDFRPYFKFPTALELDLPLCFSLITPGEYPPDIILIKDQVLNATIKNEIEIKTSLAGFIPHDYVHPVDMLLAIIDRIRKRAEIPTYLFNPVAALYVHLKLKVQSVNLEVRMPRGFSDLSFLFDAYKSPGIPEKIRVMATQILEYLRQETTINWNNILKEYPLHIWSRPRQTVVMILKYLLDNNMVRSSITVTLITEFLRELDPTGEPSTCPKVTCPGPEPPIKIPVPVYYPVVVTPPPPPPPPSTPPPVLSNVDIVALIKALGPQALEDSRLEILIKFITSSQLIEILGANFDCSAYPTTGELLRVILDRVIQSNKLEGNILQVLQYWVGKISLNGYGAAKIDLVQRTVEEKRITINMNSVLQALDLTKLTNEGHTSAYVEFSKFLSQYFNPQVHLEGFDFMKLKTRGEFLIAFLNHLQGCKKMQSNYKNSIRELLPYVQTSGTGTQPVETLL